MSERIESLIYNQEKKIMINSYKKHLENFPGKKMLWKHKIYEELL